MPVPGVTSMEHTADLAIEVTADDPRELFRRSALGMMYLLLERIPGEESETRRVDVTASDMPGLLRAWLRELLYWHETEGYAVASCVIEALEPGDDVGSEAHLDARVRGGFDQGDPVREIKGVTLHGLAAEPRDGGWYGRVIFDV